MKKLKGHEIRQMWLDFFKSKGHQVIDSASLLPHDDPTLLWINAGVAPLKKYFDGRDKPVNPRMCNAQKSIRTNDIDNVGRTSRHHTFFEMLGNFSVGDYFRNEAIEFASELLFDEKWFGIPRDLLYMTYYPNDSDTYNAWIKAGVQSDHLIPLEGNFWEIGEGPCGPDTEIFFDRGEKYDPEHLGIKMLKEDMDNDRYIEIWNIVLSQFNSVSSTPREEYPELPSKNIDTGSGLERLACIFQSTDTNFETDLFMPILDAISLECGHQYDESNDTKMAFRVIADHIRSVTFAVADGAVISNEGRGYVLRRILRRAIRYGRKLGITKPFIYKLVKVVCDNMKEFYSYLLSKQTIVEQIVKSEEENFLKTLENGEKKLNDIIKGLKEANNKLVSGKDAFILYDTFGFPIELTLEMASEQGIDVDLNGFNTELNNQKARARAARNVEQSMNIQNEDFLNFKEQSVFTGYETLESIGKVTGLFKEGKSTSSCSGECLIVLDKTPFYAEMGGQIGDTGDFYINNEKYVVSNCVKLPNGQHAHIVDMKDYKINLGDEIKAVVDKETRLNICSNHSCTHLVNASLRTVLGDHVIQHGSLVTDERLRFDFNHYQSISSDELLKIEALTNEAIKKAYPVKTLELPIEEAKKTKAIAVFGEKYDKVVRVVDMNYSVEFCGGTHVTNTSDINQFALISIESKGSGIFRIEGLTGNDVALQMASYLSPLTNEIITINQKISSLVEQAKNDGIILEKVTIAKPVITSSYQDILNYRDAVNNARTTLKELEKKYDSMFKEINSASYKEYLKQAYEVNGNTIIITKVDNQGLDVVKEIIDKLACELDKCFILFANVVSLDKIIYIAKSKNTSINAGAMVKLAAVTSLGNGGGRPDFAQAGGKDASKVDEALQKVRESIK